MIVQQVFDTVSRQIARLQKMPDHPRKAALAELRRGVGHVPGELPELWGSFLQEMPPYGAILRLRQKFMMMFYMAAVLRI